MTSWSQPLASSLTRKSALLRFAALLGIGLALMVGPLGCRVLCPEGCCSEDSDCPICIFTYSQAAPATEPVIVLAQTFFAIDSLVFPDAEPRPAGDHQLLPSRAPPAVLASSILC